jgi:hypothetical protein
MRKWAAISGILGTVWMLVLFWVRSPRLVFLTNSPALWLTASLVPIDPMHESASVFYASLVLSSAIQWAAIGVLLHTILQNLPSKKETRKTVKKEWRKTA